MNLMALFIPTSMVRHLGVNTFLIFSSALVVVDGGPTLGAAAVCEAAAANSQYSGEGDVAALMVLSLLQAEVSVGGNIRQFSSKVGADQVSPSSPTKVVATADGARVNASHHHAVGSDAEYHPASSAAINASHGNTVFAYSVAVVREGAQGGAGDGAVAGSRELVTSAAENGASVQVQLQSSSNTMTYIFITFAVVVCVCCVLCVGDMYVSGSDDEDGGKLSQVHRQRVRIAGQQQQRNVLSPLVSQGSPCQKHLPLMQTRVPHQQGPLGSTSTTAGFVATSSSPTALPQAGGAGAAPFGTMHTAAPGRGSPGQRATIPGPAIGLGHVLAGKLLAAADVPPICPQLILPNTEARFMIDMSSMTSVCMGSTTRVDIKGTSGRTLLHAIVRDGVDARKELLLTSVGCEDDPRTKVCAPRSPGQAFELFDKKGELYGTIDSSGSGAVLTNKGQPVMRIQMENEQDMKMVASTIDGRTLGDGGCTSSGVPSRIWKLTVKRGVDAVLISSCMLAMLLLNDDGRSSVGSALH